MRPTVAKPLLHIVFTSAALSLLNRRALLTFNLIAFCRASVRLVVCVADAALANALLTGRDDLIGGHYAIT